MSRSAFWRAQVSASASDSTVSRSGGSCASTTRAIGVDDAEKRQSALMEGVHSLFVGRVVDGRERGAGSADRLRQADCGEGIVVQRFEGPGRRLGPVQRTAHSPDALGPVESERDRETHVGR